MPGMKPSTIKRVVRKKIGTWLATITDERVKEAIKRDVFVTGGAIASMLLGEEVNDYDVYFKTKETTVLVAAYYIKLFNKTKGELPKRSRIASCNPKLALVRRVNIKGEEEERVIFYMKSAGVAAEEQGEYAYFEMMSEGALDEFMSSLEMCDVDASEETTESLIEGLADEAEETIEDVAEELSKKKPSFRPIFFSENAVTLSNKMQVVTRFFGPPSEVHKNYDFVHTMNYYDYNEDELVLNQASLESLLSKSLIYNGSLYPVASLFRIRKFMTRGWRITAGQMLKIIFQVSNIDLNDLNVLRDQLIGVDQAYMHELLEVIKHEVNAGKKIDATYLAQLIDRIFD